MGAEDFLGPLALGVVGFIWWRVRKVAQKIDDAVSEKDMTELRSEFDKLKEKLETVVTTKDLDNNFKEDRDSRKEIWKEMRSYGERLASLEAITKKI